MTDLAIGGGGIAILFVLLLAGLPIGVSLGLVGSAGLAMVIGFEPALIKAGVIVLETLTRYELGTLPLFLLLAHLCSAANASRDFFDAAAKLVAGHGGRIRAVRTGCRSGPVRGSAQPGPPGRGWWWQHDQGRRAQGNSTCVHRTALV